MRFTENKKGFTLIELLVVIAIIGLLASIVLVSLTSTRIKGRDVRRVSDTHQIQTALELYFNDCGQYPSALTNPTSAQTTGCPGSTSLANFLQTVPSNQSGCTPLGGTAPVSTSATYGYAPTVSGGSNTSYTVYFCTEGAVSNSVLTAGNSHTVTPDGVYN